MRLLFIINLEVSPWVRNISSRLFASYEWKVFIFCIGVKAWQWCFMLICFNYWIFSCPLHCWCSTFAILGNSFHCLSKKRRQRTIILFSCSVQKFVSFASNDTAVSEQARFVERDHKEAKTWVHSCQYVHFIIAFKINVT